MRTLEEISAGPEEMEPHLPQGLLQQLVLVEEHSPVPQEPTKRASE